MLATPGGVIWSFQPGNGEAAVLRSADAGRHWRVALPAQGADAGLVASYFLGPDRGWAVQARRRTGKPEITTVFGTSDGGRRWWHSRPLPGDIRITSRFTPDDQITFADARHGWLLGAGTEQGRSPASGFGGENDQERLLLWRTTDGGRRWHALPPGSLPLQGLPLLWVGSNDTCLDQPSVAFANAADGWLSPGACGTGRARPQVWRTSDGGQHWTATALPAPADGWGDWATGDGGVDAGVPRVVPSPAGAEILLPVAVGSSDLVIEKSADAGRTRHLAGRLTTGAAPGPSTPAAWFHPLDASHWVVSAPGRLIETADAGQFWTSVRTAVSLPGVPASFTGPGHGFVQGTGRMAALATSDGGRTWSAEQAPRWAGTEPGSVGPAIATVQVVSSRVAVAAGAAGLETSADGGRTWVTRLSVPAPVRQVDVVTDRVWLAVAGGQLLRSTDGGASWRPLYQPLAGPVTEVNFWTAADGVAYTGQDTLVVTHDGGERWQPLRLPAGWSIGSGGGVISNLGPASVCFASGGAGWAAATAGHGYGVLVTTDGGRTWRVALKPSVLHGGSIAGCAGHTGWVQAANSAPTLDLLRSTDLGRTWVDVLRTPSAGRVRRPGVPGPPGGPAVAPTDHRVTVLLPLSVPSAQAAWYTLADVYGSDIGLGSTGDAGRSWSGRWLARGRQTPVSRFPPARQWLATTALDARRAWVLFAGPQASGVSYLYGTSDAGATWRLLTVFRPPG